jgi:hypothetical protein
VNDALLRDLVPEVIGVVVRLGVDFASAEDAVGPAPSRRSTTRDLPAISGLRIE